MRYQLELEIDVPREHVVELFLDPENLTKWQPSLVSFESIKGNDAREVGAQSRQVHKMGAREVEMIETITAHDYPHTFSATYEGGGVFNAIENSFSEIGAQKTKWVLSSECRSSKWIVKLMLFFLPGLFRRQSLAFMTQFKEFAEKARGS